MTTVRNLLGLALVIGLAVRVLAWLITPALPLIAGLFVLAAALVLVLGHGGRLS